MKPKFDISNRKSFTTWEGGSWFERRNLGSSVLVADQDSNPMKVIYDTDATRTQKHALFYANVGYLLATCFIVRQAGSNLHSFQLSLQRIEAITTKQVQGEVVPDAQTSIIYMTRKLLKIDTPKLSEQLLTDFQELPSLPNGRKMMELAIEKAMTPNERQRIFYGVPRDVREPEEY